jgi:hypothetical protein
MNVAILMNERALRARVGQAAAAAGATVKEYSTAAQALAGVAENAHDLIVMDWKGFPGVGSMDSALNDLAAMIPEAELNQNLIYWEVALRVLDAVREEDSPNRSTPVIIRCPEPVPAGFDAGDSLPLESMEEDLATRQPVQALYDVPVAAFCEAVARRVDELTVRP